MANNTATFADLKRAVVHALGGTPDQNINSGEIVNDAMTFLCTLSGWRWQQKALSLASVMAQSYITLPSDFVALEAIKKASDTTDSAMPVSIDMIHQYRQSSPTMTNASIAYCLDWTFQASATVEPTPVLQLYPTPGASTAGYLIGTYLRQIPKMSGDTDLPDIPSIYHAFFKQVCRAFAIQYETMARGVDWQMMLDMLPNMERLDGRSPGYLGKYRGGIAAGGAGPNLAAQTQVIS